MDFRPEKLEPRLQRLDALLLTTLTGLSGTARSAVERWRAEGSAVRFHLRTRGNMPLVLAVLGGTGTGKSTLVNRLLGGNLSAASFRRTFTAGPVALCRSADAMPENWLGVEHVFVAPDQLPARGQPGMLMIAPVENELTQHLTLVDTPDLDGDQPAHHAQADSAFRWAQAILFLVTPEKYQMTELLPYYRLAKRYGVPALYAMNKCEEQAVLEDYRKLLGEDASNAVFAIPRDDAGYQAPDGQNLPALRSFLLSLAAATDGNGLRTRVQDLMGRFVDQVFAPLREDRRNGDQLTAALRAMAATPVGIDVNPLTQQLQRRLQQRSILYLMGPQRILDRVRQAPSLVARLPRVAWDYITRGEISASTAGVNSPDSERKVPDFQAILADQFALLQSRIDDALRSSPTGERWLAEDPAGYATAKLPTGNAANIASEELANLKTWLEQRWNATPRDTKAIQTLLKYLPGGSKLMQWTEAAPYLLTLVLVTHGAIFGHLDLIVLGGYGLATWLTERLSNEVTSRTRATNTKIADRFADLGRQQIERVCEWINRLAPSKKSLEQLEHASNEIADEVQA